MKKPGKPKGLTNKGYKINVFSVHLCNRIRTRLGLTSAQLPNKLIRDVIKFINYKTGEFIIDNPEGIQLLIGNNPYGVLAVSKHMPKELREDKFTTLESIESLEGIRPHRKKILLKRYSTALNRRIKYDSLKQEEKQFYLNPHSFFYCYRIMWFNKRNCKQKKASTYRFEAVPTLKKLVEKRVTSGFEYDELNFHNFYRLKLRPIL